MLINLSEDNSLISQWVAEIRCAQTQTDSLRFRKNMERIGEVAAYEISKLLQYKPVVCNTPLGEADCFHLSEYPVLATILRAGIPLHQGLLNFFDRSDCAFIAAYRKHHRDGSFEIEQNYITCPDLDGRTVIIADPMLATGASLDLALETMLTYGTPKAIHVVAALACQVGVEKIEKRFPNAIIWVGALDDELTAKGYIVPGLGDAGDLSYGQKLQG